MPRLGSGTRVSGSVLSTLFEKVASNCSAEAL